MEITYGTSIFQWYSYCSAFPILVRYGALFFPGSGYVSPGWSADLLRDTAKLSAEVRSSEKYGQDVKGRLLLCCLLGLLVTFLSIGIIPLIGLD